MASGAGALAGVVFGEVFRFFSENRIEKRALGRENRAVQRKPYGEIMTMAEEIHRTVITSPATSYLYDNPRTDGKEWEPVHDDLRAKYEALRLKAFVGASDEVLMRVLRFSPALFELRKATSRTPLREELSPDQLKRLMEASSKSEAKSLARKMGLNARKSNKEMQHLGRLALLGLRHTVDEVTQQARLELKLSEPETAISDTPEATNLEK